MRWYEIRAAAGDGPAELYIYSEIGMWGVSPADLSRDLKAVSGRPLKVYINSPGGIAADGVAIFNALRRHEGGVITIVDGLAASAASVIAQAGAERVMNTGAAMMIHDPIAMAAGDAAEMDKAREMLEVTAQAIADVYAERAGGEPEEWRELMVAESWYTAAEAVDAGLADRVESAKPSSAPKSFARRIYNLATYARNVPAWFGFEQASNSKTGAGDPAPPRQEEIKNMDPRILAALGITATGEEPEVVIAAVLTAITGLNERLADATAALAAEPDRASHAALTAELRQTRQDFLARENEFNGRILELSENVARAEAERRVEAAITEGRITPANRELALKLAVTSSPEEFEKFAAGLASVDLTERGYAQGAALAGLEPTDQEIAVARAVGAWDDSKPAESRRALMEQKAKDKGLKIPEGVA